MAKLKRLRQFFNGSNFYRCQHCGYELPKNEAVTSGWESQQSLRHIHCPRCGKIIAQIS